MKAGAEIFARTIVAVTAAFEAVPAGTAGAVALIGISTDRYKAGQMAEAEKGCFNLPVVPTPVAANIGAPVYAVDDNTLSLANAGGRLKLGVIEAIDGEGVWVRV